MVPTMNVKLISIQSESDWIVIQVDIGGLQPQVWEDSVAWRKVAYPLGPLGGPTEPLTPTLCPHRPHGSP